MSITWDIHHREGGNVSHEALLPYTPSFLSLFAAQISSGEKSREPDSLVQQHPSVCREVSPPQPFNCSGGWGAFKEEAAGVRNFLLESWAGAALGADGVCGA